jgi:hypothetical protein
MHLNYYSDEKLLAQPAKMDLFLGTVFKTPFL